MRRFLGPCDEQDNSEGGLSVLAPYMGPPGVMTYTAMPPLPQMTMPPNSVQALTPLQEDNPTRLSQEGAGPSRHRRRRHAQNLIDKQTQALQGAMSILSYQAGGTRPCFCGSGGIKRSLPEEGLGMCGGHMYETRILPPQQNQMLLAMFRDVRHVESVVNGKEPIELSRAAVPEVVLEGICYDNTLSCLLGASSQDLGVALVGCFFTDRQNFLSS